MTQDYSFMDAMEAWSPLVKPQGRECGQCENAIITRGAFNQLLVQLISRFLAKERKSIEELKFSFKFSIKR